MTALPGPDGGPPRPTGGAPTVVTPESVPLDLEPATPGSRGLAYALDLVIMGTGLLLLVLAEAAFGFGGFVPDWLGIALVLLLAFALLFGYPIGFETLTRGRTPGKMALGLRVVTVEGAPAGFRHATVRAVLALLELLFTLGAVALVTAFVTSRGQRLGDLAAGTMVVRERSSRHRPVAARFVPPLGLGSYTAQLDVSAIGPEAYLTVRDTLQRLPALAPDVRDRLARQLADGLVDRVSPLPPAGVTAEQWLHCVAAAVQARRQPAQAVPPAPTRQSPPAPPSESSPPDRPPASEAGGFVPPG